MGCSLVFEKEAQQRITLLLSGGQTRFEMWRLVIDKADELSERWKPIHLVPDTLVIPPLMGHYVAFLAQGYGIIIGGWAPDGTYTNEKVYWFEIWDDTVAIQALACTGLGPVGRIEGTCVRIGEYILVIGGREEGEGYLLDIYARKWYRVDGPSDFSGAPNCGEKEVYIHSGVDKNGNLRSVLCQITLPPQYKSTAPVPPEKMRRACFALSQLRS
jgi:hypothetical protein